MKHVIENYYVFGVRNKAIQTITLLRGAERRGNPRIAAELQC